MLEATFSFVIPFYNGNRFIERAIDSVLRQIGGADELILVDDGSTESTEFIKQKYVDQLKFLSQQNAGPAAARNFGAREAKGDYVYFLDCDDELLDHALVEVKKTLELSPLSKIIVGGYLNHDHKGDKLQLVRGVTQNREKNFKRYIRKQLSGFCHGSVVLHRSIFQIIRYPEGIRNNEDIVFFAQAMAVFDVTIINKPLVRIYNHPDSLRKNRQAIILSGTKMVDLLFDSTLLPESYLQYRKEFYNSRMLSIFRSLYISGQRRSAKQFYLQLFKSNPMVFFRWSYTRKFLKLLFSFE